MGALISIPLLTGPLATIATSCLAGLGFFCTSTAASMFFKSCNCNSSIATRVGFAILFAINSLLAWLMRTPLVYKKLQEWSHGYLSMDCEGGKCYGLLAVHRICFALSVLHIILSLLLIGVKDTRTKRAAIQNGWWGPKVLVWILLIVASFFIPNGFFIVYGNYISLIGATLFIILGLILLIDFAHSWSEICLENWENAVDGSNLWQWILIGSTALLYAGAITLTGIMYGFFASHGCTLNQFFISFNLALCTVITILAVHPAIQEANPRSGLAQSGMVAAYCTYLIVSAIGNNVSGGEKCNPMLGRKDGSVDGTARSTVILGAIFTFLAIAYSTTRAATQSRALVGRKKSGAIALPSSDGDSTFEHSSNLGHTNLVTTQPGPKKDTPRYQALLAAVEAGAIPASALDEEDEMDEDEGEGVTGNERDDERTGTRYNYSWFHIIFVMGSMYVGELLTDWHVIRATTGPEQEQDIYIGRSPVAMWMRVVSSWVCIALYGWSLLAPVLLPDRFGDL